MMNFDTWQWVLAVVGAMLVGVSKTGIAGLGMLFVAIFANVIPAKHASGFVLPMLIMGDLVAVASYRRHAEWKHLWRLFPWTGAGVLVGWWAMSRIDDRQAKLLIGGLIVGLVILHLWRKRRIKTAEQEHGPWFAPVIGVLAGFTTLVSNAAGPLMAIYLLAMRLPKMAYVGTGAVFFLLLNCFKVPFMTGLGLITWQSFLMDLMLAPAVLTGAMIGRWLLPKIDQKLFETIALTMSLVAGFKLLLG